MFGETHVQYNFSLILHGLSSGKTNLLAILLGGFTLVRPSAGAAG